MAGIGLCKQLNNTCALQENCLRYKGEPHNEEDAFNFPTICNAENDYEWKWEIEIKEVVE